MTPKVLQLITGEQVICALSEIKDKDTPICLLMTHPYILKLIPSGELTEDGQPASFTVNYTRWMACSSDTQFKISYGSVVSVGEPDQQIIDTYMNKFGALFNDANALSTSDSSDSSEESGVSDSGD